jgi:hypothetical protein
MFVEEAITGAVKGLLTGRVNELLGETEFPVAPIEFGGYPGGSAVCRVLAFLPVNGRKKSGLSGWTLTL